MRNKRQEQLHGFEATVPKGFTTFAIRAAILDGHRQNGMHSAHPITRDETLVTVGLPAAEPCADFDHPDGV